MHRGSRETVCGVDRGEAVADVVGHPERAQVVRRDDVLRNGAHRELANHTVGGGVDLLDAAGAAVGHVHQRAEPSDDGRQSAAAVGRVDVVWVERRRDVVVQRRVEPGQSRPFGLPTGTISEVARNFFSGLDAPPHPARTTAAPASATRDPPRIGPSCQSAHIQYGLDDFAAHGEECLLR